MSVFLRPCAGGAGAEGSGQARGPSCTPKSAVPGGPALQPPPGLPLGGPHSPCPLGELEARAPTPRAACGLSFWFLSGPTFLCVLPEGTWVRLGARGVHAAQER